MRKLALAIIAGLATGILSGAASAAQSAQSPQTVAIVDGAEIPLACTTGSIVTAEFQVTPPHPDDKEPGFDVSEIGMKVRNPINGDRGVPNGVTMVTDEIYQVSDAGDGRANLIAVAEPYAGDEYMFTRFIYCEDSSVTPHDLFSPSSDATTDENIRESEGSGR